MGCISQDTYLLYHNVYMFCTKPILSSVRTIHMQIAISKSDNESVESELLLSADSDLLRFQKTGRSKLSHRSKKYRSSLTKCMTQNFRYFQQAKKCFMCVPYNQKLQCLVSKPNQDIATSVVVIQKFQTFLKQEIQCRRMDSSETLHIGHLKNPLYKDISCIELGRIVRTV